MYTYTRSRRAGRLDRLDLWLVVVLVISVLTLRVWRLAEPYQMHFDEVYHPRTATEFLQDWRYGISHDIYEWTHPHLAKYAMALGLIAWGDDRVGATSEIGAPALAACSAAMIPAAPATFSTMTFCPRRSASFAVTIRVRMSYDPPGAPGMTTEICFEG